LECLRLDLAAIFFLFLFSCDILKRKTANYFMGQYIFF